MSKITKAVIPCGGMGIRFLPITKAVPKEILPVIDTPVVGHIVKEAIDSGITDILIILGKGKESIREYFTKNIELENKLLKSGKTEFVEVLRNINGKANIHFAYQNEPKGSGDALLYAEEFTKDEPFCLAWGDDLIYSQEPVLGQLIGAYEKLNDTVLGVQYYPYDDIVKYGIAAINKQVNTGLHNAFACTGIIEKPALKDIPSRLAALGRYILTKDIYGALKATPAALNGELQLTDAIELLCKQGKVYVFDFKGTRYDMGDKFGSVKAIVEYALRSGEYGESMKNYILEKAKSL